MKVSYDRSSDILYLVFREGPSREVLEPESDIVIELDEKGEVMGLEIWNARKRGIFQEVVKIAQSLQ